MFWRTRPRKNPANIWQLLYDFSAPLSSVALMMLGNGFYTTFISVYLNSLEKSGLDIAYTQSAYFLGMFIGGFKMEALIKKIGHIQTLAVFGSIGTSSILLQGIWQYFPAWICLRFFIGLSLAAIYIVIESWMLDRSSLKTRGVVLSVYMMCLYAFQSLSQQFLSLIDIDSYTPYIIAAFFTSLSIIPVGLSTHRIAMSGPQETVKFSQIFSVSPFGVAGSFAAGILLSAIYTFFPIFAVSRDIPSEQLMFVAIGGGVLLQWPIGKISDYIDRRKMLVMLVFSTMFLVSIPLIYGGSSMTFILATCFLIGGFGFTLYPVSITQVCDHLDHSQITTVTSFLLLIYGCGSIAGPLLASGFVQVLGINSIFLFFALLLLLVGIVGIYTVISRPTIPLEEQSEFLLLPRVSPVAYEMDPRNEPSD